MVIFWQLHEGTFFKLHHLGFMRLFSPSSRTSPRPFFCSNFPHGTQQPCASSWASVRSGDVFFFPTVTLWIDLSSDHTHGWAELYRGIILPSFLWCFFTKHYKTVKRFYTASSLTANANIANSENTDNKSLGSKPTIPTFHILVGNAGSLHNFHLSEFDSKAGRW